MNMDLNFLTKAGATLVAAALIVASPGSNVANAQTPVAHWTFDDGIAGTYDTPTTTDIVNGNNGTWNAEISEGVPDYSGLSYVGGPIGGAVRLAGETGSDNSDATVFIVPSIPQINGIAPIPLSGSPVEGVGVTWSAWIRVAEDPPLENGSNWYKGIFSTRTVEDITSASDPNTETNQNYGLSWQISPPTPGSHIDTRVSGQATDTPTDSITPGEWYHVALVWGNTTSSGLTVNETTTGRVAYLNGVPVGSGTSNVYELVSNGAWDIGQDWNPDGVISGNAGRFERRFPGDIDDLAVFAEALTDAEVLQLYNKGLAGINASQAFNAMTATTAVLEGDTNGNGVGIDDYNAILANFNQAANARSLGDLNGDRFVNLADYQIWREASGLTPSELANLGAATIPEPSSLLLVGLASVAALAWRRASCADRA